MVIMVARRVNATVHEALMLVANAKESKQKKYLQSKHTTQKCGKKRTHTHT